MSALPYCLDGCQDFDTCFLYLSLSLSLSRFLFSLKFNKTEQQENTKTQRHKVKVEHLVRLQQQQARAVLGTCNLPLEIIPEITEFLLMSGIRGIRTQLHVQTRNDLS